MATVFDEGEAHPIASAVAQIRTILTDLVEVPEWSMSDRELAATVTAVGQLRAQSTALELRLAHAAGTRSLGTEVGAADTGIWWANQTRQTRRAAKGRLKLAGVLDQHQTTQRAMASGAVAEDQAAVIVTAVDQLPVMQAEAETELVRLAAHHDAAELKVLAKRILETVAPEIAEAHEREALEREEERAAEACRFTISDDGHGQCHGRFTLPSAVGAMLKQAVLAINSPQHRQHSGTPKGLGHAFSEYVTRYPIDRLPKAGGVDATVVVTMTLDQLEGRLDASGIATLDTGEPITAHLARKLACEAAIIPLVLGGDSEILDQGRNSRFHKIAQRIAIKVRDKHCTADGCDWPAALCHVHHNQPWSRGGKTTVADGRLLCPRHHSYAHSPKYEMKTIPNGRVIFSRT